jgi:hypothetical protein
MIRLGRSEIEALIDLPGAAPAVESAPAIKAACVIAGKGRVKLPPAGHITLPCASADCPMVRS